MPHLQSAYRQHHSTDLLLPVTFDSIGSLDDMFLRNLGVDIEILTIYSLQAYIQCTSGLVAAILDLILPITSDEVGSLYDRYLSDLGIMRVTIVNSTIHCLQAYIQ